MLDSELDNESFVFVRKFVESSRQSVKFGVLRSFKTGHFVPLSRFKSELSVVILVLRLEPTFFPTIWKLILLNLLLIKKS